MRIHGRHFFLVLSILLIPAACSKAPPEKRYPMQGEVVALVPQARDAVIRAGKIDNWMEPMTMEYPIQPKSDYANLKVGDHIDGTVVVQGDRFYLTSIHIIPAPAGK